MAVSDISEAEAEHYLGTRISLYFPEKSQHLLTWLEQLQQRTDKAGFGFLRRASLIRGVLNYVATNFEFREAPDVDQEHLIDMLMKPKATVTK